ncbi:MAG: FAD-dependent oxidoreductase, partial [Actinomycetota bacterium]
MTSQDRVDVAVIGRGLVGSGAGRHLAEAGRSVAVIGPGEPTDWASSSGPFASHHDQGRITRIAGRNATWTEVAALACGRYADIEARSGIRFHTPGGVVVGFPDAADWVDRAAAWGSDARLVDADWVRAETGIAIENGLGL